MVTNNQEGIKRKDVVTIIRVGGIIIMINPRNNANNEKSNNNAGEGKKERQKVKFPCNICMDDHLTHLCPKLVEAARILSLPPNCAD
jgi:hypothetical protein